MRARPHPRVVRVEVNALGVRRVIIVAGRHFLARLEDVLRDLDGVVVVGRAIVKLHSRFGRRGRDAPLVAAIACHQVAILAADVEHRRGRRGAPGRAAVGGAAREAHSAQGQERSDERQPMPEHEDLHLNVTRSEQDSPHRNALRRIERVARWNIRRGPAKLPGQMLVITWTKSCENVKRRVGDVIGISAIRPLGPVRTTPCNLATGTRSFRE